jgi:hypothetical protein
MAFHFSPPEKTSVELNWIRYWGQGQWFKPDKNNYLTTSFKKDLIFSVTAGLKRLLKIL